jgi:hypothetical protein
LNSKLFQQKNRAPITRITCILPSLKNVSSKDKRILGLNLLGSDFCLVLDHLQVSSKSIALVQFRGYNSHQLASNGRLHSEVAPQTLGQRIKHTMSTFKEATQPIINTHSKGKRQRGSLELDSGLIQSIFTAAASNRFLKKCCQVMKSHLYLL